MVLLIVKIFSCFDVSVCRFSLDMICCGRIFNLVYMTLKDHPPTKRSLATTVCVHNVIDAQEHSAIALTLSLMSQQKHLLLGY